MFGIKGIFQFGLVCGLCIATLSCFIYAIVTISLEFFLVDTTNPNIQPYGQILGITLPIQGFIGFGIGLVVALVLRMKTNFWAGILGVVWGMLSLLFVALVYAQCGRLDSNLQIVLFSGVSVSGILLVLIGVVAPFVQKEKANKNKGSGAGQEPIS